MTTQLNVDIPAPDFSLTDVNGNTVQLKNFINKKTILLCLIRGFA
jgi:peroxiredoxin